jgi:hypothetical protein
MPDSSEERKSAVPAFAQGLSYEVHTNREVEFMLKGVKPLAWFSDVIFDDHDMPEPDEDFEEHVQSGSFVKHEVRELWEPYTNNGHVIKGRWSRFYALKDEAWRIPAFMLLKKVQDKHKWNDALERMEGSLLGYTDEQNDEWLARCRERAAGWGCMTLHALITSEALKEIEELGERAFPKDFLSKARLFTVERTPTRSALEQAGLLSGANIHLIRFGVEWPFFRDSFEHTPSKGISPAWTRGKIVTKDLNRALSTNIQVLESI